MLNFTRYIPTKFVFGRGVENQAGADADPDDRDHDSSDQNDVQLSRPPLTAPGCRSP